MLALLSIFYTIIYGGFSMKIMPIATKLVYIIRFHRTILLLFLVTTESMPAYATLDNFLQPVQFTKIGITHFFSSVFSQLDYAQDFLPYSLAHFSEFLSATDKTADPQSYTEEVIKLWTEKYKEVLFVSADTIIIFLEELPAVIKKNPLILDKKNRKNRIKNSIYQALLHKFTLLKSNPERFLDQLSDEIIALPAPADHFVTFLESVLNKLLWAEEDKDSVFETFVHLDTLLYNLYAKYDIIDEDDFYRLGNSLLCRLKYYIEIAGTELNQNFYEKMYRSIESTLLHIFELEEIEEGIISRKDFLKKVLIQGQMSAVIQHRVLTSDIRLV